MADQARLAARLPLEAIPLAHVALDGRAHALDEHLTRVAEMTARFGEALGCAAFGELAGRWHDLGKYSGDFQQMIRQANGIEAHIEAEGNERDHSSAGAVLAFTRGGPKLLPVIFAIAGHHAGLTDLHQLRDRIASKQHLLEAVVKRRPPSAIFDAPLPASPAWFPAGKGDAQLSRRMEMWTRLLFSALCDADFLDTEQFFQPARAASRSGHPSLLSLVEGLDRHISSIETRAPDTEVNRARRDVGRCCRSAAVESPGFFSLTVPTGGGKTLASLRFALPHAAWHGQRRVIVAIPYTSIIEQTAENYRAVFGKDAVVEHHSALDPLNETAANRLSSENWDAPLVVTTTVQLFESLFASKPSACRKLHNLAGSVLVLDEAQALPGDLLPAILDALQELVRNYGCTVVISTATQPAIGRSSWLPMGLDPIKEICPSDLCLFERLRRVDVRWPDLGTPASFGEVARSVAREESCLAVVHLRADARELCRALDEELSHKETVHLSALMTPAHRSRVLAEVRAALQRGLPRRFVSTQLVEAGVDIDFPVVYRALGGLDSMAQAAGRCNREGRLPRGELRVFLAETDPPTGVPRTGRDVALMMLRATPGLDLFAPRIQTEYFAELYRRTDLARGHEIQDKRAQFLFRAVSDGFRLIRDGWSAPLIVAHDDAAADRVEDLRRQGPSRDRLRALQRYTINVPRRQLDTWARTGAVTTVAESIALLEGPALAAYDDRFGLLPEAVGVLDPSSLIG